MKYNVVNTIFTRTGDGNKIAISFYQNGMINNVISLSLSTIAEVKLKRGIFQIIMISVFPFIAKSIISRGMDSERSYSIVCWNLR